MNIIHVHCLLSFNRVVSFSTTTTTTATTTTTMMMIIISLIIIIIIIIIIVVVVVVVVAVAVNDFSGKIYCIVDDAIRRVFCFGEFQ